MLQSFKNIYNLGLKELQGLCRDWLMLGLILYSFTFAVVVASKSQPDSINKATIAVVDEDNSILSKRLSDSFLPPMFLDVKEIQRPEMDRIVDLGHSTFVVVFPVDFNKDVLAKRKTEVQLNVDATRMTQAFNGSGYISKIIEKELGIYKKEEPKPQMASFVGRNRFNPNLTQAWFTSVMQLVNNITMLAIILTGAALIKERESGTLEHLLVMPVKPFEIMLSKVWSMLVVVLAVSALSLFLVIQWYLEIPVEGSILLFLVGIALHLFAVTSLGIFLACVSQNMPQLGMLLILVYMPMQMLSGSSTPKESMPEWIQNLMIAAPTTHFVDFSQLILYRGAGIDVVWKPFLLLFIIGLVLFTISLARFKKSLT